MSARDVGNVGGSMKKPDPIEGIVYGLLGGALLFGLFIGVMAAIASFFV
jgi:hypothetical protein